MHAASVHPEPGSNSLISCIVSPLGPSLSVFVPRTFRFLCSLTCKSLFIFFKRIFGVFLLHDSFSSTVLVLLFNFQGPRPPLRDSLFIISLPPSLVNTFFILFFVFSSFGIFSGNPGILTNVGGRLWHPFSSEHCWFISC